MRHERQHESPEEAGLRELFDRTAQTPSAECLRRLLVRASEIPAARQERERWWARWLSPPGWLPASAAVGAVAMLALAGWWKLSSSDPGPTDLHALHGVGVEPGPRGLEPPASAGSNGREPAAEERSTDLLAALDPVWDSDDDIFPALEPPHLSIEGVDNTVWLKIYGALLEREKL